MRLQLRFAVLVGNGDGPEALCAQALLKLFLHFVFAVYQEQLAHLLLILA